MATTVFCYSTNKENKTNLCQFVDPFVGTAYTGHTLPEATYPFGFMQPVPQTGNDEWKYCSGYIYADSIMEGFSQNRLNGTGCADLGDVLLMPFAGSAKQDFKSSFSKKNRKGSARLLQCKSDRKFCKSGINLYTTRCISSISFKKKSSFFIYQFSKWHYRFKRWNPHTSVKPM